MRLLSVATGAKLSGTPGSLGEDRRSEGTGPFLPPLNRPLTTVAPCVIRTCVVIARRPLGCRAARERQRSKGRAKEKKDVRSLHPGRFCGTRKPL